MPYSTMIIKKKIKYVRSMIDQKIETKKTSETTFLFHENNVLQNNFF